MRLLPGEGFSLNFAFGGCLFEDYGLKLVDFGPVCKPAVRWQSCFHAALTQKFLFIPFPFDRHLRQ
jgi:hypothetical protein